MKFSKHILTVSLIVLILSVACSRIQGDGEDSTGIDPTVTRLFEPVSTATNEITAPAATAVASVTASPPPAIIAVEDQALTDDGLLTIDTIVTQKPGWAVIYNDESGEAGKILGYSQVSEGDNQKIVVAIDPLEASPTLYAIFHLDEGQSGTFEFPGPDRPARSENDIVADSFMVDIQIYFPEVSVNDQEVADDGLVTVKEAMVAEPSWLVLHADEEGVPGRILAYSPLKVGVNNNITLAIDWRNVSPNLHAVLYLDLGEVGQFEEADIEQPIILDGEPVTAAFDVILAPDIYVLDQPVVDGDVVIERVIGYEPSWLVIYNQSEEETLGNIIGRSLLETGVNSQVIVTVTESAVTPILYALLHEDLEDPGEFEFPRTDPVMIYEDGIHPFTFRTDAGNYVVTRDQSLSSTNKITVSLVAVDEDAWVVIRADEEGEPGEILGRQWIPAGINRDVGVSIEPDLVTEQLHVVLHLDAGFSRVFEYPDGLDVPFQRNRTIIRAPIIVIEGSG